ncbi:hypothetical protein PG996_009212 [Apiospora saccharicola]|uniref:Uncharacterized protein n=1 Tax=Apiospora saccharicola TaxID=335842 RepID=A0ABR1UK46_9PEZI
MTVANRAKELEQVAVDVRMLAQLLQAALDGVIGKDRAYLAALVVVEGGGQRVGQLRIAGGVVDEGPEQLAMAAQAALQGVVGDCRGEGRGEAGILAQDNGGTKELQKHGLSRLAVLAAEGAQDALDGVSVLHAVDGTEID